ncbi:TapY2 family type IVa secretion system protein [Pseudoalteromonas tunicata]|uniref:TapY2 family type IVa secretion system protein n=1 Tax=Pseudoalteromonas tunicata TaxID=314281 RepID=UPI00273D0BAF|nr:TapY2 family type IVa secretion system protein [Pseudoalteromonas tunicata]MDP4982127.1 TapY2 family type IVa secretion system protein [Pseudoalteromonas tunicata]MDP5213892.1 TapY2 family type IVa secretion system protein [Pseudoalteromonas tunicata]
MKKLLIFCLLCSYHLDAKVALFDYKCHVLLDGKTEAIVDVRTKIDSSIAAEKAALKTKASFPQQSKKNIIEVYQCVQIDSEFGSFSANKLDEKTLR